MDAFDLFQKIGDSETIYPSKIEWDLTVPTDPSISCDRAIRYSGEKGVGFKCFVESLGKMIQFIFQMG